MAELLATKVQHGKENLLIWRCGPSLHKHTFYRWFQSVLLFVLHMYDLYFGQYVCDLQVVLGQLLVKPWPNFIAECFLVLKFIVEWWWGLFQMSPPFPLDFTLELSLPSGAVHYFSGLWIVHQHHLAPGEECLLFLSSGIVSQLLQLLFFYHGTKARPSFVVHTIMLIINAQKTMLKICFTIANWDNL